MHESCIDLCRFSLCCQSELWIKRTMLFKCHILTWPVLKKNPHRLNMVFLSRACSYRSAHFLVEMYIWDGLTVWMSVKNFSSESSFILCFFDFLPLNINGWSQKSSVASESVEDKQLLLFCLISLLIFKRGVTVKELLKVSERCQDCRWPSCV